MSSQEKNADSKVDSITERKPAKMGDTSRQMGTKQKTPGRSRSHSTKAKRLLSETWYNTELTLYQRLRLLDTFVYQAKFIPKKSQCVEKLLQVGADR